MLLVISRFVFIFQFTNFGENCLISIFLAYFAPQFSHNQILAQPSFGLYVHESSLCNLSVYDSAICTPENEI